MEWKECNEKRMTKKALKDIELISSLIEASKIKIEYAGKIEITDRNATVAVSLYYDSLREILEAIANLNNYKVYNHECFCAFLKEILNEPDKADLFDKLRKIRNSINYYGKKKISKKEAELIIKEILSLRKELISEYLNEINK